MGILKIARPINKAKNHYLKWLKQQGATDIKSYFFENKHSENWYYYAQITCFIGDTFIFCYFEYHKKMSIPEVEFNNIDEDIYNTLTIAEFYNRFKLN